MKKLILPLFLVLLFSSCHHETIEERAKREAMEYTQKYCPTPFVNFTRTDSISFDEATHTYTYYCTFNGKMDNAAVIGNNNKLIKEQLKKGIINDTGLKIYKDAKFNFAYIVRSEKNPGLILFQTIMGYNDYK